MLIDSVLMVQCIIVCSDDFDRPEKMRQSHPRLRDGVRGWQRLHPIWLCCQLTIASSAVVITPIWATSTTMDVNKEGAFVLLFDGYKLRRARFGLSSGGLQLLVGRRGSFATSVRLLARRLACSIWSFECIGEIRFSGGSLRITAKDRFRSNVCVRRHDLVTVTGFEVDLMRTRRVGNSAFFM